MPAETINLEASSKLISKYLISFLETLSKNPLVGFGVVGTNTLTKSEFVFSEISPSLSFVANPTAQIPFLGYSTRTTLFFEFFFEGQKFLLIDQLLNKLFLILEFF